MDNPETPEMEQLRAARRRFDRTLKAHEESGETLKAAIVKALRAGAKFTRVVEVAPFTERYVRTIARENGIESSRKPAE